MLQLHSLAVENAALKQSLSQHEYKSQLELQDLRKLCLANQDKFNYLDHGLLGDLQQEHQKQQERISGVERQVKDCQGSAHELQDKVQVHYGFCTLQLTVTPKPPLHKELVEADSALHLKRLMHAALLRSRLTQTPQMYD